MGVFSRIGDWISDRIEDAKNFVEDTVDAVKDFLGLGRSTAYDGSISQTVNVEKVLNNFKSELNEKIKEREKDCIDSALEIFIELIEDLKDDFSVSVEEAENKRKQTIQSLQGVMADYAGKHISENDPQFRAVLEMQPGDAKTEQLEKRMTEIIAEAEDSFYAQLKIEIESLNNDLAKSLEESLEEQSSKINSEKQQLKELELSAQNGTLDLKVCEISGEPTIETADYLLLLLLETP